jgi:hypothetical protein
MSSSNYIYQFTLLHICYLYQYIKLTRTTTFKTKILYIHTLLYNINKLLTMLELHNICAL